MWRAIFGASGTRKDANVQSWMHGCRFFVASPDSTLSGPLQPSPRASRPTRIAPRGVQPGLYYVKSCKKPISYNQFGKRPAPFDRTMEGGLSIEGMEEHIAQLLTCKPLSEAQVKNLCEKVRENSHSLCHPRPRAHPHSRVMPGDASLHWGAHMVLCGGTRSLATKTAMGVGGSGGDARPSFGLVVVVCIFPRIWSKLLRSFWA